MTDLGDVKQVKKSKNKFQLRKEKENEELRKLLSYPIMRAFLWRFLSECSNGTSFTGEALSTAFNEGKRQMGLWLTIEMDAADKNSYGIMQSEQRTDNE